MGMRILAILFFALPLQAQLGVQSPFFVAAAIKPASAAPSFPSGATHGWKFEEAAGNPRSDAVGSVTLTENGGTIVRTNGINGFGAYFPDDSTSLTNLTSVTLARDMSASGWFRMNVQPDAGADYFLFQAQIGLGDTFMVSLAIDNANAVIGGGEEGVFANSGGPYSLNTWHLAVAKWLSDDSMWVSIDGGTFTSGTIVGWPSDTSLAITVGGAAGTLGGFTLDEVWTWHRALTQQEAIDIWNGGAGTFGP